MRCRCCVMKNAQYQTVSSWYQTVWIPWKVTRARTKITTFKNHPRDILRHENHLYGIIYSSPSNMKCTALKTRKCLLAAGYRIFFLNVKTSFEISSHCLTHSLTDHSRKPRAQTKQRTVTILRHNNKLTGGMCLLGFWWVYALCTLSFLLSSIRLLVFFFIQRNHIKALIFHINTFFIKQHNRRHKII